MGLLAFFKFGLIFLDALAWPLFALAYPLLASVHAIETNSGSDMEKLVTYWTIFSLISLFEHAFTGLLQWLPFWPYMKLTLTCWMVIRRFDGAFYVYNHFVHPCLNVDMQSISNWFNKFQGFFFKHYFLDKDVKGLEKPVATENDMKAVQVTEKKEVGPVNLIPEMEHNAAKMEVPEMSNMPSDKQQVQKEWTCAMCQVTTTSETTLNSHLQGRRHRDTWEELMKAKNSKAWRSKSNPLKEEPNNSAGNQVKVGKRWFRCTICNIYCGRPEDLDCHLWGKKHLARIQELHSLARGEPA